MNIDKLKDQCQFCKHFDIGHIDCCSIYGECLYNFDNHNRPIGNTSRWELHPDIADTETTELCYHTFVDGGVI